MYILAVFLIVVVVALVANKSQYGDYMPDYDEDDDDL